MAAARELVAGVRDLVSLPEAYLKIRSLVDDPQSTTEDFARAVQLDPGLAARLLRIANSAFFGVARRVETISLAVNLMGIARLHDLVLTTTVIGTFDRLATSGVDLGRFWSHSLHTGIIARMLAGSAGVFDSERLFVGGLLHDIGYLVMHVAAPEPCHAALERSRTTGEALASCERDLLGCDRAEVGAELMRVWQFPPGLIAMCAYQAAPWHGGEHARECALVHAARAMAATLDADPAAREPLTGCDPRALELARLDGVALREIAAESLQHLADAVEMLLHQRHAA